MGCRITLERIIAFIITLLAAIALLSQPDKPARLPSQVTSTQKVTDVPATKTTTITASETPQPTASKTVTIPTPTRDPQTMRPEPGSICSFDPAIQTLINELQLENWVYWIELLSGEKSVSMNGETYTILTRYSESMFSGADHARGYDFVIEQLRQWGYEDNVDLFEQEFTPFTGSPTSTWKNIIVLVPGSDPDLAQEQVLLTGHLDSTSMGEPEKRAPGADDNGSGAATLLEAARILRGRSFNRTIKIIFFTGEEQGLHGSRAYVSRYQEELDKIIGVFNLDMFGYDADNDRCFEIHVGWMKDSNIIGGCLADTVEGYDFGLKFDYLVDQARGSSDHVSFWNEGVGAIEVLENFDTHNYENGCGESDINPNYHTEKDLISAMNLETGHAIAQAVIAAATRLAEMVEE